MSEAVSNYISSESLCTVIETIPEGNKLKDTSIRNNCVENTDDNTIINLKIIEACDQNEHNVSADTNCDTLKRVKNPNANNASDEEPVKVRSKLKKSVSFDPNDEKVKKFITGEPIVDQQNPFKNVNGSNSLKKKKTPPPVPTKRSTLSVRKTVTQQLREREREKEKERERAKNEVNSRKNHTGSNGNITALNSPDDFITTEEVLKQSKYVKTYIKNQDPYFVFDPTVLARIKFEELREIADKKPPKKLKPQPKERTKDLRGKLVNDLSFAKPKLPTFKKCSKPNYPELADIKIKVGTDSDGNYFNPAEVTKNAKKFDERAKKLHLSSDDDLDEIDEPLTKSESSDEITNSTNNQLNQNQKTKSYSHDEVDQPLKTVNNVMHGGDNEKPAIGTFTNTIKSKEFQAYLDRKGLTLIPKNQEAEPSPRQQFFAKAAEERAQISTDTMDDARGDQGKKPSVFQRLLSNSIFAARRKTTPKEIVPMPRSLYETKENYNMRTSASMPIKRVVLERQSFHGRPRASNLLSASEVQGLKTHSDGSRKSFASGDDLSLSISSALTNAEDAERSDDKPIAQFNANPIPYRRTDVVNSKPISKPPRRTLSRDRLGNIQAPKQQQQINLSEKPPVDYAAKPKLSRTQIPVSNHMSLPRENDIGPFKRTLERQSLIPRRTGIENDRPQLFGRTASMDRNEILKRNAERGLQSKPRYSEGSLKLSVVPTISTNNLHENFNSHDGPKVTSTPIRNSGPNNAQNRDYNTDSRTFVPINKLQTKASPSVANVYVDQHEWEQLRAMKERTDRELYYKVLQQQQQSAENIYEHLQPNQVVIAQQQASPQISAATNGHFVRGSPQRNTFSGVIKQNRQAKIIDGKAVLLADHIYPFVEIGNGETQEPQVQRCQSVLDDMTSNGAKNQRRGYESETESSVVLRRKGTANATAAADNPQPRRIGGLLTREEILQKVKEFCRKSLNKTPTHQHQMQAIYERHPTGTDLSPVSYASVETHHRPGSRMYAAPQVPLRMQSLPQQYVPIIPDANGVTSSPIYAHVIKRSSIQSNQSEMYEAPQLQQQEIQPYLVRRESDTKRIYLTQNGITAHPIGVLPQTQYVLVDTAEQISPGQLSNYQQADIYAQPQYIRQNQLHPGTYGYITVREPISHLQFRSPQLHDGRSTPLILDRSSQQASQIYWTPQHQRLQRQAGLLPVQISPRYTVKQTQPVSTTRINPTNRVIQMNEVPLTINSNVNIPNYQHQQQQQQFSPLIRSYTPTKELQKHIARQQESQHVPSDWESGSEAGEVRRIMENHHQREDLNYVQQ